MLSLDISVDSVPRLRQKYETGMRRDSIGSENTLSAPTYHFFHHEWSI